MVLRLGCQGAFDESCQGLPELTDGCPRPEGLMSSPIERGVTLAGSHRSPRPPYIETSADAAHEVRHRSIPIRRRRAAEDHLVNRCIRRCHRELGPHHDLTAPDPRALGMEGDLVGHGVDERIDGRRQRRRCFVDARWRTVSIGESPGVRSRRSPPQWRALPALSGRSAAPGSCCAHRSPGLPAVGSAGDRAT